MGGTWRGSVGTSCSLLHAAPRSTIKNRGRKNVFFMETTHYDGTCRLDPMRGTRHTQLCTPRRRGRTSWTPFTHGRRCTVHTQAHCGSDPTCAYDGWLG